MRSNSHLLSGEEGVTNSSLVRGRRDTTAVGSKSILDPKTLPDSARKSKCTLTGMRADLYVWDTATKYFVDETFWHMSVTDLTVDLANFSLPHFHPPTSSCSSEWITKGCFFRAKVAQILCWNYKELIRWSQLHNYTRIEVLARLWFRIPFLWDMTLRQRVIESRRFGTTPYPCPQMSKYSTRISVEHSSL